MNIAAQKLHRITAITTKLVARTMETATISRCPSQIYCSQKVNGTPLG